MGNKNEYLPLTIFIVGDVYFVKFDWSPVLDVRYSIIFNRMWTDNDIYDIFSFQRQETKSNEII